MNAAVTSRHAAVNAAVRADMANALALCDRLQADINRGWDLIERVASKDSKPEDALSEALRDWLNDAEEGYALFTNCHYQIDASVESLLDTVLNVVRKLWEFLTKLWDAICHCFRYLFNTQYRAAAGFVKCQQKIALLAANDEALNKFLRYETGGFVTPKQADEILTKTDKIVSMFEELQNQKDAGAVDAFVKIGIVGCGIEYKDGKFVDSFESLPLVEGTYGSTGWDGKNSVDFIKRLIDTTGRSIKIKRFASSLESDMSSLKRKINNALAKGASSEDIADTQTQLIYKTKMFRVVQAGVATLNNRIAAFDALFSEMAYDAELILNGKVGD